MSLAVPLGKPPSTPLVWWGIVGALLQERFWFPTDLDWEGFGVTGGMFLLRLVSTFEGEG